MSGEFNSQEITNTLCPCMTMGRKPGDLLIGTPERRTEEISGDFNSEDIVNTLWS